MNLDYIHAFEITDIDTSLKAQVIFDKSDYKKPLDVYITDTRGGQSVMIPFELFDRLVASVRAAADQ